MMQTVILPLNTTEATLSLVGGKGLNLTRLVQANLPVPGGFLVATPAYQAFVAANRLQSLLSQTLQDLVPDDPAALQAASDTIRAAFAAGSLPPDLRDALSAAYETLAEDGQGPLPVAVRSSATAEDLPDMSFAGQQDTFLNVLGTEAVLRAVIDCWSSLWTARAIGYRARNGIAQDDVSLAVVVQCMVPSEASGVLFTANPLNGKRTEMVIDAIFGLGEALVSGQVEPDQYIFDVTTSRIVSKKLGAKALAIHGQEAGGTDTLTVSADAAAQPAISDAVIWEVVQQGKRVAALFDYPQDIEWGWANGRLYLLQSRPITSLYPVPDTLSQDTPLRILFSFGSVQGMLDPMTTLGRDAIAGAFAGSAQMFKMHRTLATQRVIHVAGERLWIDFTTLYRHPIGRKLMRGGMGFIDPSVATILDALWDDPRLSPQPGWFKFDTFRRIGYFLTPIVVRLIRAMRHPDAQRVQWQRWLEAIITDFAERNRRATTLSQRVTLFEEVMGNGFALLMPRFLPLMIGGVGSLNILMQLSKHLPPGTVDPLTLTRGLPHNVTTEMDMALWQTAQKIRADEDTAAFFSAQSAADLAEDYLQGALPPVAQTAVADFLERYGMRGVGEIDLGRRRWREVPTQVMQNLQSYLHIPAAQAPDILFAKGAAEAESAVAPFLQALRRTRWGRLKARVAQTAVSRMRALAGLRESPKFLIIRLFGIIRAGLLASGEELVKAGFLSQSDDLFYLHLSELKQFARDPEKYPVSSLISARRAAYAHEQKRRQIPRLLLSDGHAFYEGIAQTAAEGDFVGTPVSPGTVEGHVHVVLDPHGSQLKPGEILVCPGTDPAWTPLFLAAGGLVMEVGGMMTHGSVVAREYGIPAVVGVHQVTQRLQTGQMIRVDGSTGVVTILAEPGDNHR